MMRLPTRNVKKPGKKLPNRKPPKNNACRPSAKQKKKPLRRNASRRRLLKRRVSVRPSRKIPAAKKQIQIARHARMPAARTPSTVASSYM